MPATDGIPSRAGTPVPAADTPSIAVALPGDEDGVGVEALWTPRRPPDGLLDRVRGRIPVGAIVDPGRRGVAALAAVALLACVIAGWSAWRARPRSQPLEPIVVATGAPAAGLVTPSPSPIELVVAVGGKVRRPGLVRLRPGARVADAVRAAGGILPGTELGALNLARKVVDGELVLVGTVAAEQPAPGATAGSPVNLNTATVAELDALPGVGPVLAQRIVDHRRDHGAFTSVDQLREVDGIGDAKFGQLRDRVTV
jgi:competence protein ComEA